MNKVTLYGRLGADPETRTTQTGTVVTKLRVATSERVKDRDGNWNEHTEWHRVTAFGTTASNCARYLTKGREVLLEGKLRTSKYQDRDGNDRYTTKTVARHVEFLTPKSHEYTSGGGGRGGYGGGGSQQGGGRQEPPANDPPLDDDQIPF